MSNSVRWNLLFPKVSEGGHPPAAFPLNTEGQSRFWEGAHRCCAIETQISSSAKDCRGEGTAWVARLELGCQAGGERVKAGRALTPASGIEVQQQVNSRRCSAWVSHRPARPGALCYTLPLWEEGRRNSGQKGASWTRFPFSWCSRSRPWAPIGRLGTCLGHNSIFLAPTPAFPARSPLPPSSPICFPFS